MPVVAIQPQIGTGHQLGDRRGAEVGGLLGDGTAAQQRFGADQPAGAQRRRHRLGQARQVEDGIVVTAFAAQLPEGGKALVGEAQVAIRIVLDDQEAVLAGQLDQLPAAGRGQHRATGIGKVWHRIKKLRCPACRQIRQCLPQGVDVQAIVIGGDLDDVGRCQPQGLQRGRIGGRLDQHRVTRIDQRAHQQIESLLRTGRDHDPGRVGRDAAPCAQQGQLLAQRLLAFGGTVLEMGRCRHGPGGGLLQALHVEQGRGRITAGQRDHAGQTQIGEQLADRRAGRILEGFGKAGVIHDGFWSGQSGSDRDDPCGQPRGWQPVGQPA